LFEPPNKLLSPSPKLEKVTL